MRNDLTEGLGNALNRAFTKSRMSAREFIEYLKQTRKVFDTTDSSFHAVVEGEVMTFYFTNNRWWCKA